MIDPITHTEVTIGSIWHFACCAALSQKCVMGEACVARHLNVVRPGTTIGVPRPAGLSNQEYGEHVIRSGSPERDGNAGRAVSQFNRDASKLFIIPFPFESIRGSRFATICAPGALCLPIRMPHHPCSPGSQKTITGGRDLPSIEVTYFRGRIGHQSADWSTYFDFPRPLGCGTVPTSRETGGHCQPIASIWASLLHLPHRRKSQ